MKNASDLDKPRHQVGDHRTLALHVDRPTARQVVALVLHYLVHVLRHLDVVHQASRVHPRRDVDRIAPDVVLWFTGANHPGHYRADVDAWKQKQFDCNHHYHLFNAFALETFAQCHPLTDTHPEVVEGMLVDVRDLLEQLERVVHHREHVLEVVLVAAVRGQPGRGHVRGAGRFDFLHVPEPLQPEQLVKVDDDFVQQAQTLDPLVIAFQLDVELGKVRYRREHHAHRVALFVLPDKVEPARYLRLLAVHDLADHEHDQKRDVDQKPFRREKPCGGKKWKANDCEKGMPLEDQRQHDDGRNVQHEYDDKQQDFEENFNKLMHRTGQ
uniref:Uncharacterized protein n=1 Tax=Anopheles coluzzii TaxID=1518534 RepID=A0A8W7PTJ4_ANOCL